jgi:hypothetical protein
MSGAFLSYSLYNYYYKSRVKNNLILDPLSSLLKIGLLQYEESGTKVSIQNNSITYVSPSLGQGFFRSWKGDCREDLHNLCKPLMQCLAWFDRTDPRYQRFYEECRVGLQKLKEAYDKDSTIHHTITHYINIVGGLSGPEQLSEDPDNPLVKTLRDSWTEDEIRLVHDILQLIKGSSKDKEEDKKSVYIKSLTDIIGAKDAALNLYLSKVSTTY